MTEPARRGSAEVWLDAAHEILLESGIDAVSISALSARLNLARASFYWFFKDRDALLEALLEKWRSKNTGSLVRQSGAYADSIVEGMLNVTDCWFSKDMFDSRLEFAIRSWAIQSASVQAELHQADSIRILAIKGMLVGHGMAEATADVRARSVYLVQMGYVSLQIKEDLAVRMQRIPEYVAMFTGIWPDRKDLQRFYFRHNYKDLAADQ